MSYCEKLSRGRSWSVDEKTVWNSVCLGGDAYFQSRESPFSSHGVSALIRASFFEDIYSDPKLTEFTSKSRVSIGRARIEGFTLQNSSIGGMNFNYCNFLGFVEIIHSSVAGDVSLEGDVIPDFDVVSSSGGSYEFLLVRTRKVWMQDTSADNIRIDEGNVSHIELTGTHIADTLSIGNVSPASVMLSEGDSMNTFITLQTGHIVDLYGFGTAKTLSLDISNWTNDSSLRIAQSEIGKLNLRSVKFPDHVYFANDAVHDADWGASTLDLLNSSAIMNMPYQPWIYRSLAKASADNGNDDLARQVLFDGEKRHVDSLPWGLEKFALSASQLLAGFGYRPEYGFIWIFGFVLLGVLVFASGGKAQPSRPRSWFMFSLDAVLPGIHLDSEHEKIGLEGWRQYFLYFLRFLGAVVVVIILSLLRKSIDI